MVNKSRHFVDFPEWPEELHDEFDFQKLKEPGQEVRVCRDLWDHVHLDEALFEILAETREGKAKNKVMAFEKPKGLAH